MDLSLGAVGLGVGTQQTVLAQILGGANFFADLTHSLVLSRGTGSPTFTRATTATVRDNEGVLRTAIAGEARFEGARRVRNLVPASEDFSVTGWTKNTSTISANAATAPNGTATADLFYPNSSGTTAGLARSLYFGVTQTAGNTYHTSIYCKYAGIRWLRITGVSSNESGDECFIDLVNGVIGTNGSTNGTVTLSNIGDGWYRVTVPNTAALSNTGYFWVACVDANGGSTVTASGTDGVYLWGAQLEDITGRTDQTTPSEYVSVGVLSAPYHGAGVDGVKCFPTDLDGNPIPSTTNLGYLAEGARTNLCLQSNAFTTTWTNNAVLTVTQDAIGPDGATSAWTLTQTAGSLRFLTQTIGALTAANYTLSFFVKKTTGAQSTYPVFNLYAAVPAKICGVTVDTTNGVATVWTSWTGLTVVTSSATCVSHNANYWRVSLTGLLTADSWRVTLLPAGATSATQATGEPLNTTAGSAVFYGAQVELGSFASSYIATTTIAVARNADVLTYSSAGNISETAGWVYAEVGTRWTTSTTNVAVTASSSSYPLGVNNGTVSTVIVNRDGTNYSSKTGLSDMATGVKKRASSWSGAGLQVTGDGLSPGTNNYDGAYGNGALLAIGSLADGTLQWNGTIRNVRIGQRALSSSELQAVTA